MKLTQVEITNFRCFTTLTVPLRSDVNVFVGVNGAGKTAILDAIAIALYDIVAANSTVRTRRRAQEGVLLRPTDIHVAPEAPDAMSGRQDFVQIRAQADGYYELPSFPARTPSGEPKSLEWTDNIQYRPPAGFLYDTSKSERLSDIYRYFQDLWQEIRRSDTRALIPLPVVAYYRANRRISEMPRFGEFRSGTSARQDAFENALNAGADYGAMVQWLYHRENQELREWRQTPGSPDFEFTDLRAVRLALKHTLDNVSRIFFGGDPPSLKVEFINSDSKPKVLELEQLSDGQRNLLALILDFARRLAQAHPSWINPLEAPGILLIDEIELHLHPQWQQRIIPNLREIFPNTQLITATHSPQVLTTVQKENIAILKDYALYSPHVSTYGAESKRVMLEVMQTENRPPDNEVVDQLSQLFSYINQGVLDKASEQLKELIGRLGSDEPALIEAETTIKNLEWEKELGL